MSTLPNLQCLTAPTHEFSRIAALVDPGTPFLELSALAGHEVYPEEDVAAGGIVTGIGSVEGVLCVVVANDSTYVHDLTALK